MAPDPAATPSHGSIPILFEALGFEGTADCGQGRGLARAGRAHHQLGAPSGGGDGQHGGALRGGEVVAHTSLPLRHGGAGGDLLDRRGVGALDLALDGVGDGLLGSHGGGRGPHLAQRPVVGTNGRASGWASTRFTMRGSSAGSAPKSCGATASPTWRRANTLRRANGPSTARTSSTTDRPVGACQLGAQPLTPALSEVGLQPRCSISARHGPGGRRWARGARAQVSRATNPWPP